ncbi:hypothetical protein D3C76_939650 [compost metagenome]
MPGVIWLLTVIAERQQGIFAHIHRQTLEVVLLFMPAATLHFVVMPQMRPAAFRQIKLYITCLAKYWCNHHRIPKHVLTVQIIARRIVREFEHHRAQHRRTHFAGQRRLAIQVRHHPAFQLGEVAHHVAGLVIVRPWHTVGFAAVQAAMAGEQPEGAPAFIHMRRRGVLEPTDIVAPEAKA